MLFAAAMLGIGWLILDQQRQTQCTAMKLAELAAALAAIDAKLGKARTEIVSEIQKLREALGDVELPAAARSALAALEARAQELDDVVPDAPPAN